jgi:CheY-like chemotaxis protein
MYRFLIVEDLPTTLKPLVGFIEESFEEQLLIETAADSSTAIRVIEHAVANDIQFDAVILDFRIPLASGERPQIDETVCRTIRELMRGTLIVHITGHPDDKRVLDHVRLVDLNPLSPNRAVVVSKLQRVKWASDVVRHLKQYLYGTPIHLQLDQLFPTSTGLKDLGRRGRQGRGRSHGRGTHALAAVIRDIVNHWSDLDDDLKERIRATLTVEEDSDGRVRVSL